MIHPDFDAIVFDCDGVLVDSEPICARVVAEVLTQLGYPCTPESIGTKFTGSSRPQMLAAIEAETGLKLQTTFPEVARPILHAALHAELRPTPGLLDALEHLNRPAAVASNAHIEGLRLSLQVAGLLERFDPHVYSSEHVANPKPSPDVYLHAIERIAEPGHRILVVEDSEMGIRAGVAAGATVVGFIGAGHASENLAQRQLAAGASAVISAFTELDAIRPAR